MFFLGKNIGKSPGKEATGMFGDGRRDGFFLPADWGPCLLAEAEQPAVSGNRKLPKRRDKGKYLMIIL